jgi:ferredoxin
MITVNVNIGDQWLHLSCPQGYTLMQCLKLPENNQQITQLTNNIMANCGGNMSCSTCIVKIHEDFIDYLDFPNENELMLVDIFLDQEGLPFSEGQYRLSCQIPLGSHLNGLKVHLI